MYEFIEYIKQEVVMKARNDTSTMVGAKLINQEKEKAIGTKEVVLNVLDPCLVLYLTLWKYTNFQALDLNF